jgi:hypothetical protein
MSDNSFLSLENRSAGDGGGVARLAFGFGFLGRSCLEEEIEAMEGLYDLAVLEADEDDDSIAAIKGGIASCGGGGRQHTAKYIMKIEKPNQKSLSFE